MAQSADGTVRAIAWSAIFPWLILAKCVRIAIQPRLLVTAAAGLLLTASGWAILEGGFSGWCGGPAGSCPWRQVTSIIPDSVAIPSPGPGANNPITTPWFSPTHPFRKFFRPETAFHDAIIAVLCGGWAIAVWGFFGGLITRSAAIQLTTGGRDHVGQTFRFVTKRWKKYVVAPATPLIGVAAVALPLLAAGLVLRMGYLSFLAALAWPLILLGGFLIAVLLAGLMFGWPLMWANISTEGVDAFDAISRSYDYVFHRPLHYAFYAVVASGIGLATWLVVYTFTAGIVAASYWAVGWGSGADVLTDITTGGGGATGVTVRFWIGCLKLVATGFLFSYFWSAASAIYLLLRRDNDATEMDEARAEDEDEQETIPLPSLKSTVVAEPPAGEPAKNPE